MIRLRVNDQSGATGPYRMTGDIHILLPDNVKVQRQGDGLALIEQTRKHVFNKDGEYIGSEQI